jgi:hypothetical protein
MFTHRGALTPLQPKGVIGLRVRLTSSCGISPLPLSEKAHHGLGIPDATDSDRIGSAIEAQHALEGGGTVPDAKSCTHARGRIGDDSR